jgi:sulfoquinovosidase
MPNKTILISAAILFVLLISNPTPAAKISVGKFTIATTSSGAVSISRGGRELFRWLGVEAETFDAKVSANFAFFKFAKENEMKQTLTFSKNFARNDKMMPSNTAPFYSRDYLTLETGGREVGSVHFGRANDDSLAVYFETTGGLNPTGLKMRFACGAGDRFWGFGEQYNYLDMRGHALNVWVQEQGVGRKVVPPSIPPGVGTFTDSYFPMPYFMDSKQGRGFLLDNSEYSRFDMCAANPKEWTAEVWDTNNVSFHVFPGPKPADVVAQLTAVVGRPKIAPPDWAFGGVWLAAQGGTAEVRKRFDTAMADGIPVSAFWVQDWVGKRQFVAGNWGVKYRWVNDEELYPGLDKLIADMNAKGVRFLGYFNNFVIPDFEHYKTGAAKGYIVKNQKGEPYTFQIITFPGGVLDVFNPSAVMWFQSYARKAVAMGQSGWMCDFGEWMPYDSVAGADGQFSGRSKHNLYATEWHRINRQVLEDAHPDGDFVLLTRSGFTGEQKVAQIVWAADQEQDWKDEDGLPTVIRAALTIGLSGVPYYSHDIAGFSGGPSTRELFMRWTELGAFTPVMRTHDGLKKKQNHKFDTDAETLAHFKKFALIHAALLPYFKRLALDAVSGGLPMIRHTVLVDPDWSKSLDADWQWMIGDDLLVAPVVKQGAGSVTVYFPRGDWQQLLTVERYKGRTVAVVKAPLGTPAVFVRAGRMPDVVKAVRKIYGEK